MKRRIFLTKTVEDGIKKYKESNDAEKKSNFVLERNIVDEETKYHENIERINCLANSSSCTSKDEEGNIIKESFKHETENGTKIIIDRDKESLSIIINDEYNDDIYLNIPLSDINLDSLDITVNEYTGNRHHYYGTNYRGTCMGYAAYYPNKEDLERPIVILNEDDSKVIKKSSYYKSLTFPDSEEVF